MNSVTPYWNQEQLEKMIQTGVEESLTLDYKAAGALEKTDSKKIEVTKDVSAMANSAGGTIIYGIREFTEQSMRYVPEKLDPIDRQQFPKEWLENVVNNIRPRLQNCVIHVVHLSSAQDHVIYVVEVPQSKTAHQALDKRYYKRFNFQSVPMEDYEIRDILNRVNYPDLEIEFTIGKETWRDGIAVPGRSNVTHVTQLSVSVMNVGDRVAEYVQIGLFVPAELVHDRKKHRTIRKDEKEFFGPLFWNTHRDVLVSNQFIGTQYGPSRFHPVLPECWYLMGKLRLVDHYKDLIHEGLDIHWILNADNAPRKSGSIKFASIPIGSKDERH